MLDKGDLDGCAVWKRILRAVEELQGMVSQGWALAYRRYSLDYVDEEADAQAARRGIWAGEFVRPWEWRRGERLDTGN